LFRKTKIPYQEAIERFIEAEAFLRSFDSAPRPPLPPPPLPVSKLDRRHTRRLRKRDDLLTGEGGRGGRRGAESYDRKKA